MLLVLGAVAFTAQTLVGLAIGLNGLTLTAGRHYPRWVGVPVIITGAAWMIGGLVVDIEHVVVPATLLTWIWTIVMAVVAWRGHSSRWPG